MLQLSKSAFAQSLVGGGCGGFAWRVIAIWTQAVKAFDCAPFNWADEFVYRQKSCGFYAHPTLPHSPFLDCSNALMEPNLMYNGRETLID